MQPPPSSPPQWSPDGQWWWDGTRWRPRNEPAPAPAPAYTMPPQPYGYQGGYPMPGPAPIFNMPPPVLIKPSPGLRIVLIVSLSLAAVLAGLVSLVAIFGTVSDSTSGISTSGDIVFLVIVSVMFAVTVVALVGSVIRARWSRVVAIIAGVAVTLTCIGALVGIPIIVTAARAPDLTRKPA